LGSKSLDGSMNSIWSIIQAELVRIHKFETIGIRSARRCKNQ
jgi:hypothetical protein